MTLATTAANAATGLHRERAIEANGLRFHYWESGAADAPPIVLLHGLMGVSREWDVLTATLAARFRVLAIDQRGHGGTDWAQDYRAETMAADLAALIERLGLSRPHVIGHSMGGINTMICAAEWPELVGHVVVIDVGPDSLASEWGRAQLPEVLAEFAAASYATLDQALEEWLSGDPLARRDLMHNYVVHNLVPRADGRLVWRYDAARVGGFTADLTVERLWWAVDRIAAPTLVIRGQHSPLLEPSSADEMVRRFTDARMVEIPDGAHDLGVEQPEAVAAAVLDFLPDEVSNSVRYPAGDPG